MLRFALPFLGLITAFLALGATAAAERMLHSPLCHAVAEVARALLSMFGDASVSGQLLRFDGFDAVVVEACNGFLPTAIYVAAVLAFPCSWRAKGVGLLVGVPAIQVVNVVRVVSLMVLGAYWPALFERMHIFVWQTLVIACTMAIWVAWIESTVERDGVAPAHR